LNLRPLWRECINEISKYYVVIVFTASQKSYADSVLDFIDPKKQLIKFRLYRDHCVKVKIDHDEESSNDIKIENEFIYVKDLRIIKNVSLRNMIIIDNSVLSFSFNLENGIPILPFYDNYKDNEFIFLKNYLIELSNISDVRDINRRAFKLNYLLQNSKEGSFEFFNMKIISESEENNPKNITFGFDEKINNILNERQTDDKKMKDCLINRDSINLNFDVEKNTFEEKLYYRKEKANNQIENELKYEAGIFPILTYNIPNENKEIHEISVLDYTSNSSSNFIFEDNNLNITYLESYDNCSKKNSSTSLVVDKNFFNFIDTNISPIHTTIKRKKKDFKENLFNILEDLKNNFHDLKKDYKYQKNE